MSRPRVRDDRQGLLILGLLLTGVIANAAIIPFMSVFIVKGLGEPPWKISVYVALTALVTLTANRQFGERIDAGGRIAPLILTSLLAYFVANTTILLTQSYLALVALASICFGLSNASVSSMYSLGRLYADTRGLQIARYNAYLRSMTSLGWMIAPALSFLIADRFGYLAVFRVALALAALWAALWWIAMPKEFAKPPGSGPPQSPPGTANPALRLAAVTCFFFALAHVLCASALPLFYLEDVGLPGYAPGLSFTIKTAVEIVAILAAPALILRFGPRDVLVGAACVALVAFWRLGAVENLTGMAVGAAIEGFYYGLFAGVGISYMQDLAQGRIARATSIYMNSLFVGGLMAGALMGMIAQAFDYRTAIHLAALPALGAMGLLFIARPATAPQKKAPPEGSA